MELRKLGEHGPTIAPVVYGAWQAGGWFWGEADDAEQVRAMQAALDAGINAIDTAPVYGMGHSEEVVGRAIRGRRDEVVVMTKFGLTWSGEQGAHYFDTSMPDGRTFSIRRYASRESILRECEASLSRLGVDAIDLYQLHWPAPAGQAADREPEAVMEALNLLLEQGKIKAIGVSNCPPEWMERAKAVGPLTCHQPKWSWLSRAEENRSIAWSRENGVGAIVYSALEMGLLTGKITPDRKYAAGDERAKSNAWFRKPQNIENVNAALRTLEPMAGDHGCSMAQLMLAATIAEPGITGAIVGARNAEQARDNAGAMQVRLGDEERATIRRTFEGVQRV